jgi:glycosyltransferase involved in cell wall biosynthesis
MKILVATDAWHPQVNGVVRTYEAIARCAPGLGHEIRFLTPDTFRTFPLPGYPEIKLALASRHRVTEFIQQSGADAIHIATEGPIGHAVRNACLVLGRTFTSSFHTRLPDYIAARTGVPESWSWSWLRWFHRYSARVMAATPGLMDELQQRGIERAGLWPRGVDTDLFCPREELHPELAQLPRPIFLAVGRLALEKNLAAVLGLDLPGTTVVVGDGPERTSLTARFPRAVFLGNRTGDDLAHIYSGADVFVFPSETDTYGLVLLEALASGLPVAAFPAQAPREVLAGHKVGALDHNLRAACLSALEIPRERCRAFAMTRTWEESAQCFVAHAASSMSSYADQDAPIGAATQRA